MSDPVVKFIADLKRELVASAEAAMVLPKADPFEHGVVVGRYRGMREALDMLVQTLKESDTEGN